MPCGRTRWNARRRSAREDPGHEARRAVLHPRADGVRPMAQRSDAARSGHVRRVPYPRDAQRRPHLRRGAHELPLVEDRRNHHDRAHPFGGLVHPCRRLRRRGNWILAAITFAIAAALAIAGGALYARRRSGHEAHPHRSSRRSSQAGEDAGSLPTSATLRLPWDSTAPEDNGGSRPK